VTTAPSDLERWEPGDGVDRVLVVTAHPDDVDFGAAGTVATFRAWGAEVAYCIVTDGDAGGSDRSMSRPDVAALRRKEQRAAAAEVGVADLTFLGYPDGRLSSSFELRRDLSRVIRQFRPGRVLTSSPERDWRHLGASHPDHLAVGEAVTCAVYPDARNPFAHPELLAEGLEPHVVPELWLMAGPRSDVVVDTSAVIERKIAALTCHASQIPDPSALRTRILDWGTATAAEAGLPAGATAEAFQRVRIN
jgi:LmbE family N-acetylglucosaminyl deacetylase